METSTIIEVDDEVGSERAPSFTIKFGEILLRAERQRGRGTV